MIQVAGLKKEVKRLRSRLQQVGHDVDASTPTNRPPPGPRVLLGDSPKPPGEHGEYVRGDSQDLTTEGMPRRLSVTSSFSRTPTKGYISSAEGGSGALDREDFGDDNDLVPMASMQTLDKIHVMPWACGRSAATATTNAMW